MEIRGKLWIKLIRSLLYNINIDQEIKDRYLNLLIKEGLYKFS